MSKETYSSVKRDLLWCKKRPTLVSKETYSGVKRGPQTGATGSVDGLCGDSRNVCAKETYSSVKRDLL